MEIRQVATFVQIVQQGSFSRAAGQLGYTQSAVTIQIRRLEEELGVRLFDRVGKKVTLTSQGSIFLPHACAILRDLSSAEAALSRDSELTGELRIGTIDSICETQMLPVLRVFRTQHPKVRIQISIASPEELILRMERGQVDLIYILDEPRYSNSWIKALEVREPVVFAASAALGLGDRQSLALDEILPCPFFLTEANENYRRTFDKLLAARSRTLEPVLECSSTEFLIRTLTEIPGISLLPRFAVREAAEQGLLDILPVSDVSIVMYRQIFYHRDKWCSREMEAFIQAAGRNQ